MATVDDVARAALAAIDTNAGLLRAVVWASERYRELTTAARFKHLRQVGELHLPAPITAGLATFTRDSTAVVGDATASPLWTPDLIGRHIRAQVNWYEIVAVLTSPTAAVLTLKSAYAESPTVPQPQGYRIVQRFVPLATNVRFLGSFVHMRRRRKLELLDRVQAEIMLPGRQHITGGPRVVIDHGVDPQTGGRIVELYPYTELSEQVVYTWWPIAPALDLGAQLPHEVDVAVLKEGVLIDLYRFEMARAMREAKADAAAVWGNYMRSQQTVWDRRIAEAVRADRAADDLAFVLRLTGTGSGHEDWIRTAHDQVYETWPR